MKIIRFWFPVIIYSGIIFYISGLPRVKLPLDELSLDKLFHLIEYIPFGFLVTRAFVKTKPGLSNKDIWIFAFITSFLYGFSDEIHQMFVSGRVADVKDMMFDTVGGMIGCWMYRKHQRQKTQIVSD